ncbi:MAG: hypothetical protein HUK19_05340 [Fibrobacter sp.]|mgnify:FL=1|nr:hypothetical protein [Fibrobacter sp.]
MKKIITFSAIAISSLMFTACDNAPVEFSGCWQGEASMIFEVIDNKDSSYTIRNINGDLSASVVDGKLCGKNTLDMPYCMGVKGDSAYYEFGGITTGYKRISRQEYNRLFESQKASVNATQETIQD